MIVNGWKPLAIITKSSILDLAAVLDPALLIMLKSSFQWNFLNQVDMLQSSMIKLGYWHDQKIFLLNITMLKSSL